MKKWISTFAAILIIFFVTACGETMSEEPFIWPESIDGQSPFYGETISIGLVGGGVTRNFSQIAQEYMRLNPGVTIEIVSFGNNFHTDTVSVRERIGLELMAGTAPTLIDNIFMDELNTATLVDYQHTTTAQYFVDWLPLMAADPNFNEDDWFMNVFEALTRDGRMLGFPISYDGSFGSTYIVVNATIPELLEEFGDRQSISFSEMIGIHSRIAPVFDRPMYIDSKFDVLFAVEHSLGNFFDFDSRRVEFATPEFIEFITHARELTSPWRVFGDDTIMPADLGNRELNAFESQNYLFRRTWAIDFGIFPIFEEEMPFTNPALLTNYHGDMFINPFNTMLLNASASDVERALAMDFLRFSLTADFSILSRHNHEGLNSSSILLNRVWMRRSFNDWIEPIWIRHGWNLLYDQDEAFNIIASYALAAGQMPMHDARVPEMVRITLRDTLHQFHDGLITAEQTANDLQNRITLMLMEMD